MGGDAGSTFYNDVWYASLDSSTGAVGTWAQTTSFNTTRSDASGFFANGYVYLMGGLNGTTYLGDTQYAAVNANGTIGPWQFNTTAFTTARRNPGVVAYQGFVYLLGGKTGSGVYVSDVQYAPIQSIPRIGHYSKLIDLGVSATLQSITSNGVLPGGIRNINYRAAGNDGIFGALTNAGSITGGGAGGGGCGGAGSGTRYVWVSLTLDDSSYDAVFADSGGPDANVTDFTINYTSNTGHPTPNIRLRGGQYFNNNTLQPLDTCGP
jgi:hypothetical protein